MIMETMGFIIKFEKEMKLKIQVSPLCWLNEESTFLRLHRARAYSQTAGIRARAYSQTAGIRLQALPLASWVTLGKLLDPSEPQFSHL